ncbi:MAG: hypothetical protein Q8Q76_01135 [Methylotenera sp.]|nr:hypothetical protein [Methylotenera sp.]
MTNIAMNNNQRLEKLANQLEQELTLQHGPMVSNDDLRIALGYASMDAFRQSLVRKTVPIPVFSLPNRRGKYALVKDLALWLAQQREAALLKMEQSQKTKP